MKYKVGDTGKLLSRVLDRGVLNCSPDEAAKVLAAFFDGDDNQPQARKSLEDIFIQEIIVEIPDSSQRMDLDLLRKLNDHNYKNVTRLVNIIRRFIYRKRGEREVFEIFDEIPSEIDATSLYFLSKKSADSGAVAKPWEYERFLGKVGFDLLKRYLKVREIIN